MRENIRRNEIDRNYSRVWQYDPIHLSVIHWHTFSEIQAPPFLQLGLQVTVTREW